MLTETGSVGFSVVALIELESQKTQVLQSAEAQTAYTTAPVITLLGSPHITIALNSSFVDAEATCTDDVDGVIAVDKAANVNITQAGNYTIIYSCTDNVGNAAGVTRGVTVAAEESVCDFTKHPSENPDSCYGAQSTAPTVSHDSVRANCIAFFRHSEPKCATGCIWPTVPCRHLSCQNIHNYHKHDRPVRCPF